MKMFVSIPQNTEPLFTFFDKKARDYLKDKFEITYSPYENQLNKDNFKEAIGDAEVVVTSWGHPLITAEMLEGTNVKYIVHAGGSVKPVASPELFDMGIKVISGNPCFAKSVAEGTIAYMLTSLRKIPDMINNVRAGGWKIEKDLSTTENYWRPDCGNTEGLLDKNVGIIGFGAIAKHLVDMIKCYDVNIKVYAEYKIDEEYLKANNIKQVSLEEIFETSDIVTLHMSATPETDGLIKKKHFDLLRDGAIFVNTARGSIIDEEEMIEALKEQRFKAIIDVLVCEPASPDSPLRTLPNVYLIPHCGGPTTDRRSYITRKISDVVLELEKNPDFKSDFIIDKEAALRMTRG